MSYLSINLNVVYLLDIHTRARIVRFAPTSVSLRIGRHSTGTGTLAD